MTSEEKAQAEEQEIENLNKEFRDSIIHFPMFHRIPEEEFKVWKAREKRHLKKNLETSG